MSSALVRGARRVDGLREQLVASRKALAQQIRLTESLQRIVMPSPAPVVELDGVRVAARYDSADHEVHIGGDWCAAVPLATGDLVLAVGDVVGHGLPAATTMNELRHGTTALAAAGLAPSALLAALNTMLWRRPGICFATAVVAMYRRADAVLTWARAGHPPILVASGGTVTPRYDPPGILLGARRDARYEQAVTRLGPGDLLLMYTDGLVETRDRCLDDGVGALTEQVRAWMAGGGHVTEVVERIRRRNPADDVCVLAVEPFA